MRYDKSGRLFQLSQRDDQNNPFDPTSRMYIQALRQAQNRIAMNPFDPSSPIFKSADKTIAKKQADEAKSATAPSPR